MSAPAFAMGASRGLVQESEMAVARSKQINGSLDIHFGLKLREYFSIATQATKSVYAARWKCDTVLTKQDKQQLPKNSNDFFEIKISSETKFVRLNFQEGCRKL